MCSVFDFFIPFLFCSEIANLRLGINHDFGSLMEMTELTVPVLDEALSSNESDLEDGIVCATTELLGTEAIITCDASAYRDSSVPAMDAHAYC